MHGHGHVVAQHSTAIASDPSRLLRPTCVVRLLVNPLVCEATCCFAYNCVLASHDLCKLLACYARTAKGGRRVDRSTYHSTAQNSSNCLHLVQTQLLSTYHVPLACPFFAQHVTRPVLRYYLRSQSNKQSKGCTVKCLKKHAYLLSLFFNSALVHS